MEEQQEQPEIVVEQPKKNAIPTRLGSLIILLVATIAGAGVWWYAGSYTPLEVVDVSRIVEELQERREIETEFFSGFEIRDNGVYEGETMISDIFRKDSEHVYLSCGDTILEGIDVASVEWVGVIDSVTWRGSSGAAQLDMYVAIKDINAIYYIDADYRCNKNTEDTIEKIEIVDAYSFRLLGFGYAAD